MHFLERRDVPYVGKGVCPAGDRGACNGETTWKIVSVRNSPLPRYLRLIPGYRSLRIKIVSAKISVTTFA